MQFIEKARALLSRKMAVCHPKGYGYMNKISCKKGLKNTVKGVKNVFGQVAQVYFIASPACSSDILPPEHLNLL